MMNIKKLNDVPLVEDVPETVTPKYKAINSLVEQAITTVDARRVEHGQ